MQLFSCELALCSGKRKDAKGCSVSRATTPTTDPGGRATRVCLPSAVETGPPLQRAAWAGHLLLQAVEVTLPALWAWRAEDHTKEGYYWALRSNAICFAKFVLAVDLSALLSYFFPFGMDISVICLSLYTSPLNSGGLEVLPPTLNIWIWLYCWLSLHVCGPASTDSITSEELCLVAQSCPTLCNPMDCSWAVSV